MRRLIALALLVVALAPGTWLRETLPPPSSAQSLHFAPVRLPVPAEIRSRLGAFRLEAVWRLTSPNSDFGGYSALLHMPDGRFLAISDRGYWLRFSSPDAVTRAPPRFGSTGNDNPLLKADRDSESATRNPRGDTIWIGWESSNAITRHDAALRLEGRVRPPAMRDWGGNTGPEAMAMLADGRFLVLCEGYDGTFENRRHRALAFAGDPLTSPPPLRFTFEGPEGFMPTDMAQLPDGRVLVLMRRLLWPFPIRFDGRIVIVDPTEIRRGGVLRAQVVARLESPLPVDNFEGIAITPGAGGQVNVWIISDDNNAATQRTLLWKMAVDPAKLPGARKKAREKPPRPSAS